MNLFDWVLIALFAVGALYGFRSGLVQAVLNLVAIYAALFLSGRFAGGLIGNFTDDVSNEAVATAIGYVIIFIIVFVAAQIAGNIIRTMLSIVFLGWVDRLGGILLGVVFGILLAGGLMTMAARYTYVVDDDASSGSLPQRFVEDYLNQAGRERVDRWLTQSELVPVLLSIRDAAPGDMFGLVTGDFRTALDVLQSRVDQAQAQQDRR